MWRLSCPKGIKQKWEGSFRCYKTTESLSSFTDHPSEKYFLLIYTYNSNVCRFVGKSNLEAKTKILTPRQFNHSSQLKACLIPQ